MSLLDEYEKHRQGESHKEYLIDIMVSGLGYSHDKAEKIAQQKIDDFNESLDELMKELA